MIVTWTTDEEGWEVHREMSTRIFIKIGPGGHLSVERITLFYYLKYLQQRSVTYISRTGKKSSGRKCIITFTRGGSGKGQKWQKRKQTVKTADAVTRMNIQ